MNASAWVVVTPKYNRYGALQEIKLDRIVQQRPQALSNGERAFRLGIDIPESVFDPFAHIDITVPEGAVIQPQIEVG